MGTDTSMQNSLASTQFFRMLGVSGDDLGEAIILSKISNLDVHCSRDVRTKMDIQDINNYYTRDGIEIERDSMGIIILWSVLTFCPYCAIMSHSITFYCGISLLYPITYYKMHDILSVIPILLDKSSYKWIILLLFI